MLLLNMMITIGCETDDVKDVDTSSGTEEQANESETEESDNTEDSTEDSAEEEESESEPSSETNNSDEEPVDGPEEEEEEEQGPLAIIGIYYDQYSTEHSITQTRWLINVEGPEEYLYTISQYSNSEGYIIAFNQTTDPNEDGLWSRINYQASPDILQVCHTTYSAATEEGRFSASHRHPVDADHATCPHWPLSSCCVASKCLC